MILSSTKTEEICHQQTTIPEMLNEILQGKGKLYRSEIWSDKKKGRATEKL